MYKVVATLMLISLSSLFSTVCSQDSPVPFKPDNWQTLQSSIGISAMHMQLLHDETVVIFDRTDFGRSNLSLPSGLCRLDPNDTVLSLDCTAHSVLYDVLTNTFRPLMIQTDTWCSSGSVLPNGTLVQTGGFNDGDRAIRMFSPCGIGGTCNWSEWPGYLLERRWYATNQILPDGRMIIVGGRRQFNYEFYPREPSASKTYNFEFLLETRDGDENNLYPFLHLLPDGNLFVFANTRSILFDYGKNSIVKEFPPIPGSQPRNYPSSGSSVLLPLQENGNRKNIQAEVMICGGAPQGSYTQAKDNRNFVLAVRTCGRLEVTQDDPEWEMDNMPMPRVMGDMLILPTGDIILINGAESGTAGWENGEDPVTRPIIYHTTDRRFSVMSPSSRARMYHSSAILLSDGRVLVGGSNPHVFYNFANVEFPTDLSLEAYSPPYLSPVYSTVKPRIISKTNVLRYGRPFSVTFTTAEYLTSSVVSVRIVAPSFTTHSFAMNQRMVVLTLDDVAPRGPDVYSIDATGPSSPTVAPPGYYMLFVVHAGVPSSASWVMVE